MAESVSRSKKAVLAEIGAIHSGLADRLVGKMHSVETVGKVLDVLGRHGTAEKRAQFAHRLSVALHFPGFKRDFAHIVGELHGVNTPNLASRLLDGNFKHFRHEGPENLKLSEISEFNPELANWLRDNRSSPVADKVHDALKAHLMGPYSFKNFSTTIVHALESGALTPENSGEVLPAVQKLYVRHEKNGRDLELLDAQLGNLFEQGHLRAQVGEIISGAFDAKDPVKFMGGVVRNSLKRSPGQSRKKYYSAMLGP